MAHGALRTLGTILVATLGCGTAARADTNSGLDLTRPLLQAGYRYQNTYFSPGVLGDARAFSLSLPLSIGQFKFVFPYSEDLRSISTNTRVSGQGDLMLSYNYVLPLRDSQFRQTVGLAYASPSGRIFSAHEQQMVPFYQLSYRVDRAATILLLAKYAIGYDPSPGTARYNELILSPTALLTLHSNTYVALVPEYHHFSGRASQSTYGSSVDVGRLFNGVNVMVNYGLPLDTYSYRHLYRSTYGVSASLQI